MAGSIERDQIIDPYKIQNLAGQDQFRDYYSAYEIDTGKPITLAVLRQEYADFDLFNKDYLHRIQSLIQIRHPNLTTYLQTGVLIDSRPYVAVEPVSGFPLSERLERLAQGQDHAHATYALTLVKQIASGLVLLERLNLYHYALTPDHVLLKSVTLKNEGSVVVTDLDIPSKFSAEFIDQNESAGDYLSPEQRAGHNIDGRSHMYSLGVMLHELLCGEVPDQPMTPWRKLWSTFRGGSMLAQKRPNLAPETCSLVEQSLNKNPKRRFASLEEFQRALDRALAVEEAPVHTLTAEPASQPRRTFMIPIAMLAVCIVLGLLGVWFVPGLRSNPASSEALASGEITTINTPTETPQPTTSPMPEQTATPLPSPTPTEEPLLRTSTAEGSLSEESPLVTELYESPQSSETPLPEVVDTATATATLPPTDTPEPIETPEPAFRILTNSANVRAGPGINYDPIAYVYQGERLEIIGRSNGEYIWLNVLTESGVPGWVAVEVGELDWPNNLLQIQVAATIPPPPTPTMTATPTNTPVPPTATPLSTSGSGDGGGDSGGGNGGGSNRPGPTPTPPF
jgi:serine/threonine protein kinase